jgi:hypothetical protein
VQGSPPRRPLAASGSVPAQHVPGEAPREAPALPGPRPAPAALPPELVPGVRPGGLRNRAPVQPDRVVFTAACPACGQDCVWNEEREDTRLHAVVTCPCAG